ncbi:MAG: CoA transferase [Pseudomonadota bacterium]|nr:CoA transferase [Pseudomonadota bacterium]
MHATGERCGPLSGVRVLEFAGLGPAPFCAMLLADMGAQVLRIDRDRAPSPHDVLGRGKAALRLDLKAEGSLDLCLDLLARADVLIEGFRPGVMERLGLGPEPALACNPRLIYGRMTGWGQDGPLATAAGHDINFVAVAGALGVIGEAGGPPVPPLNLVGDFGGGAMYLAFGIAAALVERERSGRGQVIDAAIVDGTAHLMTLFHQFAAEDATSLERGRGLLGGAAPFYRTYACADGRHLAVGPLEPKFYAVLLEKTGAEGEALRAQYDRSRWDEAAAQLAVLFAARTRDDWCALLEGTDACVSPVLDFDEVPRHPHMAARGVFTEHAGLRQPAPAPRFSRTPGAISNEGSGEAESGWALAERWGVRRRE